MVAFPAAGGLLWGGQEMAVHKVVSPCLNGKEGRGEELGRGVGLNANGLNEEEMRKETVEKFKKEKVDVLGISETHLKDSSVKDSRDEDEGPGSQRLSNFCFQYFFHLCHIPSL